MKVRTALRVHYRRVALRIARVRHAHRPPGLPHWRAAHPWKPRRAHAMQHHGVVASLQVVFRNRRLYRGTTRLERPGP